MIVQRFKILFSFLFLLVSPIFCQEYMAVDNKVKHYPNFTSIDVLSIRIQNDFETDAERVRAAFTWVARNIAYIKSLDNIFKTNHKVVHYSEFGKQKQIQLILRRKMERAFDNREGVCIDYSLLLNELCSRFGLRSRVIVGTAKTEIRDIKGKRIYKNHTWNAVNLDGEWQLMDPTWTAALINLASKTVTSEYLDHYFFTEPSEFIKHHLPVNPDWQLLAAPVDTKTFFKGPIYFPEYFGKGIMLSSKTRGIIPLSAKNEHLLYFDEIPSKHVMYYSINGSSTFKRLELMKSDKAQYFSKIKLRKKPKNDNYVTVYLEQSPILNFKIEK